MKVHTISTKFAYMTRQSLRSFSSMVLAHILESHRLAELSPRLPEMSDFHVWSIMDGV